MAEVLNPQELNQQQIEQRNCIGLKLMQIRAFLANLPNYYPVEMVTNYQHMTNYYDHLLVNQTSQDFDIKISLLNAAVTVLHGTVEQLTIYGHYNLMAVNLLIRQNPM